jgi:hypothetical protein
MVEEPGAGPDELEILDQELSKLASHYRDLVLLWQLQGLSRKEVAARLGSAEGTVSSRLAMAKRELARSLQARVVSLACMASATRWTGSVPASLVEKIANTATTVARGETGIASPHVLSAADGVTKGMMLGKLRSLATTFAVLASFTVVCPRRKPLPMGNIAWAPSRQPWDGTGRICLSKRRASPGSTWRAR